MVVVASGRTATNLLLDGSASSYSGESPPQKWRSSVGFIASPDGTGDDVPNEHRNKTIVEAMSGCWDLMAELWNNFDDRCACVGHRRTLSRRPECDVLLQMDVKAIACLCSATRHTGAIQGSLGQPVAKSRSAGRRRMSSAKKPSTHGMEPRLVKGLRVYGSVASPGDNVDVFAREPRIQQLTATSSSLVQPFHATQLHSEATMVVRKVIAIKNCL
ncbi:hypothetical protein HPB50_028202 [Hyalomma asiaticum]|nr:hypothetical protein HPB50_028202 [Hyalomma asiaticum]